MTRAWDITWWPANSPWPCGECRDPVVLTPGPQPFTLISGPNSACPIKTALCDECAHRLDPDKFRTLTDARHEWEGKRDE